MSRPKSPEVSCLVPSCNGVAKSRGLCVKCYAAASVRVKSGKITWDQLVALGLAKPSERKPGAFTAALSQANAATQDGDGMTLPWSN